MYAACFQKGSDMFPLFKMLNFFDIIFEYTNKYSIFKNGTVFKIINHELFNIEEVVLVPV